jgi:DNA-binding MarR family transcriptional regulator
MATASELLAALRRFGLEDDRFDAIVAHRLGAPPAEFKAMDHLHEAGSLTASELADRLALTSGAVTALIDRLERLGWARREPHPTDRRSIVVRKADDSGGQAERIYVPYANSLARAARELSPTERDAAVRFLEAAGAAARAQAHELQRP